MFRLNEYYIDVEYGKGEGGSKGRRGRTLELEKGLNVGDLF